MLKAQEIVSRMDLSRRHQVTKAFATYFELTNLAETNHASAAAAPANWTANILRSLVRFAEPCCAWKESGISTENAAAALSQIAITPVFTAHPTEVRAADRSAEATPASRNNWNASTAFRWTAEKAEDCENNIRAEVPHSGRPTKCAWRNPRWTMKFV